MTHIVVETLQPKVEQLIKDNEHLQDQIQLFEDFAHNYKLKYDRNLSQIEQLTKVINQIK